MSQYNSSGVKAFKADATITKFQRVKLTSTGVDVAGSNEYAIGFAEANAATGESVGVKLINSQGTFKAIAAEAVAIGGSLYGLASGKVGDTDPGAGTIRFIAITAGTGDGSIIEIMPKTLA